jgi:predicted MFS family arabinose efflux permease
MWWKNHIEITDYLCEKLLFAGWQAAFFAFIYIFVILLFVIIGVPKSPPNLAVQKVTKNEKKVPIPPFAYIMLASMILIWISYASIIMPVATWLMSREIVPMNMVGVMMGTAGICVILSGIVYPFFAKYRYVFIGVSLALVAVGYFVAANAHNAIMSWVALAVMGFGANILVPYITTRTAANCHPAAREKALGLVQAGIHSGVILATFISTALIGVFGGNMDPSSYTSSFSIYGYVIGAVAVIFLIYAAVTKNGKNNPPVELDAISRVTNPGKEQKEG